MASAAARRSGASGTRRRACRSERAAAGVAARAQGPGASREDDPGVALLLVALAAVGVVFEQGRRLLLAPWSFGEPTLTGAWEGPLRANLGAEYRLFLDLDYYGPMRWGSGTRRRRGFPDNLKGTARLCTPRAEAFAYEVSGDAHGQAGDVKLSLEYGDPRLSVLDLNLAGAWGGRTLTLRPHKNPFDPDGTFRPGRPINSAAPDDSFGPAELRKATPADFEAACRRLAAT